MEVTYNDQIWVVQEARQLLRITWEEGDLQEGGGNGWGDERMEESEGVNGRGPCHLLAMLLIYV